MGYKLSRTHVATLQWRKSYRKPSQLSTDLLGNSVRPSVILGSDISKLIESINRVGIQNVSLLSRMTGMPKETIRYVLKKRFPDLGLQVGMLVDYEKLGLERYFAVLKFPHDMLGHASEILHKLASVAFLTYRSKLILEPSYLGIFSIPVVLEERFLSFLDRMIDEGIVESVSLQRLEWARHPELKNRYYDFSHKKWAIDWEGVKDQQEPPPAPILNYEPSARPELDVVDAFLIKELEIDSYRNVAEVARKLGVNERSLRWHHKKHVVPLISSYYVRWRLVGSKELKAVGVIFEFNQLTRNRLNDVRRLFNNFPFTLYEVGRRDGYYQAHCAIPTEEFVESLGFLSDNLKEIVTDWKTFLLDLSSSVSYTVPYENFDDKAGWVFDRDKALNSILSIRTAAKNIRNAPQ